MIRDTSNCGMKELHNLTAAPKAFIQEAYTQRNRAALIIFSDSEHRGYGNLLFTEIVDYALGRVVRTDAKRNPRSGNAIRAFAWSPDYAAVGRYLTPKTAKRPAVAGKRRRAAR